MIISHSKKFVFVHIPKCAGTAITYALLPYLDKDDLVIGFDNPSSIDQVMQLPFYVLERLLGKTTTALYSYTRIKIQKRKGKGQFDKHSGAIAIKKIIGDDKWRDYFTFTFVRNPWDRTLSFYSWYNMTSWSDLGGKADEIRALSSFDSYVKSSYLEPQCSDYIYVSGKPLVDFIGRQENLQKDFHDICRIIGLPEINLTKENVSRNSYEYRDYYTDETRSIIKQMYSDDIMNFKYVF